MHDSGGEDALCIGDAKGRQLFGCEGSEDDTTTAGTKPPPGRAAGETLHIGIGSIDVKKSVHDVSTRRAVNALNVPPGPAAQLDMHGPLPPTSPSYDFPLEQA